MQYVPLKYQNILPLHAADNQKEASNCSKTATKTWKIILFLWHQRTFFLSKKNFQEWMVTTVTWFNTTTFETSQCSTQSRFSKAPRIRKRCWQVSLKAFLKLKWQVLAK